MQNKLRKVIREVFGHYLPLDDISDKYAKTIMEILLNKFQQKKKKLEASDNLRIDERMSDEDKKTSKIWNIRIDIIPDEENNKKINYVSGRFMELQQDFIKNAFQYSAKFEIYIINWDYKIDLTNEIKKVFSHELFHAFQYITSIDSNNYSKALYNTRNKMKGLEFFEGIDELERFMDIFYLSLPQEISARTHEAYNQMKNLKLNFHAKTHDEVLKELDKLSVFRDFLKVQKFRTHWVLNLDEIIKEDFVEDFNKYLLRYSKEGNVNSIKIIDNPDEFFNYWVGRAKRMSLEARHKIVSQAINLFADKEIVTEYGNPKYRSYMEQLLNEIFDNINCSGMIYNHSLHCYYYDNDGGDDFRREIKNYSKFVI